MFEDLTGKQFNNWLVLGFSHKDNKRNYWNCECQCERKTKRTICTYNLVYGLTKSCGCSARDNLIGQVFNDWKVLSFSYMKGGKSYWLCECKCNNKAIRRINQLKDGITKDCGCSKLFRYKGLMNTDKQSKMSSRLAGIWYGMHDRCQNFNNSKYLNYGGRGIIVCKEWHDYKNFKIWSLKNNYSEIFEIDRIDVNGNYEPSNCRWVTHKKQCDNKQNTIYITINGIVKTLTEWVLISGLSRDCVYARYRKGLRGEELICPSGILRRKIMNN